MAITSALKHPVSIFLCIMFACYLVLVANTKQPQEVQQSSTVMPSLYTENATLNSFDYDSGSLTWTMRSPLVSYFEESSLLVADTPTLALYEDSHTSPWFVDAGRAAIYRADGTIRLNNGVELRHIQHNNQRYLINTERLDYYPKRHFAEAIYPVEIQDGTSFQRGDTLKIWLEREYIKLEGNVRGNYVPAK